MITSGGPGDSPMRMEGVEAQVREDQKAKELADIDQASADAVELRKKFIEHPLVDDES